MANYIEQPRLFNPAASYQEGALARNRFNAGQQNQQINAFNLQRAQEMAPMQDEQARLNIQKTLQNIDTGAFNLQRAQETAPMQDETYKLEIEKLTQGLSEDKLKMATAKARRLKSGLDAYMSLPIEQQASEYEAFRQTILNMGGDPKSWPEQYDPRMMQHQKIRLYALSGALEEKEKSFGLNPVYGKDASGNLVIMQMDPEGGVALANMPPGVVPVEPKRYLETGLGYTPVAPRTGEVGTEIPKDVRGAARETSAGKEEGKRTATAAMDLPKIEAQANYSISLLDDLLKHPGLKYAVGKSSVMPIIPGTAPADFITRLDQIQGQQFLQAYQQLRGGGQITEVEGQKAEAALARMQRVQSEPSFIQAVKEFRQILADGLKRARAEAGISMETPNAGTINRPPSELSDQEIIEALK